GIVPPLRATVCGDRVRMGPRSFKTDYLGPDTSGGCCGGLTLFLASVNALFIFLIRSLYLFALLIPDNLSISEEKRASQPEFSSKSESNNLDRQPFAIDSVCCIFISSPASM